MKDILEYGVRYVGGITLAHQNKKSAQAAIDRAKRYPVVEGAALWKRRVTIGDWQKA